MKDAGNVISMNEEINLEIQYTVDDYVRGVSFVQNRQFINKYGFAIAPLLLFLFGGFIFALKMQKESVVTSIISSLPFFVAALIVFLVLLLLRKFPNPILKWNIKRQFRSSPLLNEPQRISFDEEGINGETYLSSGLTKWAAIIEATETKDDLFFFTSNKFAMFVPKRAFVNEEQINQVRQLAKESLGEKAKF